MSSWLDRLRPLPRRAASWALIALIVLMANGAMAQNNPYPGLGRAATPNEVAAWDIDVRPDFKGLPLGAGTVANGMLIWEARCASCHGIFGESNEYFNPIVGGTSAPDIKTGRVASLNHNSYPGRTTLMKLSTLSTLWDYISRAMPWNAPKSLTADEVYAVTAYILHLGDVLPETFTLSDKNMAQVQALLPNRNGKTSAHALWPNALNAVRRPDVLATACMNDCGANARLASFLPDFARNAHGNLAEQNRLVGAQRGADTSRPMGASAATLVAVASATPAAGGGGAAALALAQKHTCTACHGLDHKIVGPALRDIAKKYAGRADALAYLAGKIKTGGAGVWGPVPMPPQALAEADAKSIAQWLADGARP